MSPIWCIKTANISNVFASGIGFSGNLFADTITGIDLLFN